MNEVETKLVCSKCGGRGYRWEGPPERMDCEECDGRGTRQAQLIVGAYNRGWHDAMHKRVSMPRAPSVPRNLFDRQN